MSVNHYLKKEPRPQTPSLTTEDRFAAYLDFAREAKHKPPTKDLWKAVSTEDLESTAAWVVAGEKTGAKLVKMFGGRARAGSEALGFAAAIGWADGVSLLLATPSIPEELWWRALPLTSAGFKNSRWWPRRTSEPAEQASGYPDWAKADRLYTPLGFALANKEEKAATILVEHYRAKNNSPAALPIWMICRTMRQMTERSPSDPVSGFLGEGSIGVHLLSNPSECFDNAVIFAMLELPMEMARALVLAGGGSPELAQEFAWAATHGRAGDAKMLLAANPKSRALMGPIGQDLVRMAVDQCDAELARALWEHGVDISNMSIHGLKLAEALGMSHSECWDYLKDNGWTLDGRDREVLMAFAKDAQKREAAEGNAASKNPDGDQPELDARANSLSSGGEEALGSQACKDAPSLREKPKAEDSPGCDKQLRVDAAVRELEEFGEIVAKMGLRIKDIIAELKAGGAEPAGEAASIAEPKIAAMRERAAEARKAIANAGAASRRGR